VLAGPAGPAEFEAERFDLGLPDGGPGGDLAGANLGAGGLWTCTRAPSGVVGPVSASALPHAFPGTSTRQWARSSAISKSIGANSIPRTSSISWAKPAGQPPACPPKITCSASRWGSSARSSMKNPMAELMASPVQMFPSNPPTPTTLSPSSAVSP